MGTGSPRRTDSGTTTVTVTVRGMRRAAPHSTAPPQLQNAATACSERRQGAELLLDVRDRAVHELRALRVAAPQDPEEPDARAARLTEHIGARVAATHTRADER